MRPKMTTAYLSVGSNLGDRETNLNDALFRLRQGGAVPKQVSDIFETEPFGFRDQPWFLNMAVEIETGLSPRALLDLCRKTEAAMGRVRTFQDAPRTLDLDILLYSDQILDEPDLIIPHPRMLDRRFVLAPLAQIAADLGHPVARKSISVLLASCPDPSVVLVHLSGDLH